MKKSRTQNAIFNSSISMIIQVLKIIVSFVNRSFFIYFLCIVYLGLNGLFTSILSMLSLAELGMTTAIAVSLYKPLAENDYSKVNSYMNLFKNIYIKISGIVGVLGLIISFFLPYLIKDVDITAEIYIIYYLFLINAATSYLFTYKRTLLEADQKRYIIVTIDFFVFLIGSILQWLFLITTGNFIVYLLIMILMTISSNILISRKIERIYNYISDKEVKEVTKIEKRSFYRNVKGTVISKIAETIVFSTDNILMSAFISVNTVGLYANYSMIVSNIQSIVSQLISSLSGSLGNLIHTENSSEKATIILKKYQFIVFILTLFASTGILLFSNILIIIWLGKEYLFSMNVVFVIVLSFFITLYRIPFLTFINSYGLFWEQRVKNVVEAMLNLVFSVGMLLYTNLGILSILLGTVLSSVFTVLWYEPYSVYKFGLRISPKKAIKGIVIQYSYALAVLTVIYFTITKFLMSESIYEQLVYNLSLYFGVIVITTIVFSKTKEFKYIVGLVCKIYKKIFK